MTVLSPSSLETTSYRQQGWNAISSSNMQLLNTYLTALWGPIIATYALGERAVINAAAATQIALTDSSGGTPSATIAAISGSGADTDINNNLSSLTKELEAARADIAELRTQLNALLTELRTTGGNGVLDD